MPDYHYWKHGIYRGHIGYTNLTTVAYLDGFTRAKNFEDVAWNAFGDVPGAPVNQSPIGDLSPQSDNSPSTQGSPVSHNPSSNIPATSAAHSSKYLGSVIAVIISTMVVL